jgi:hypothetical protein
VVKGGCHCDYFEMFKMCVPCVDGGCWLVVTLCPDLTRSSRAVTRSPKNFNLEQRKIEQTYWNLQKRLHPDLYGSKSEVRVRPWLLLSLLGVLGANTCLDVVSFPVREGAVSHERGCDQRRVQDAQEAQHARQVPGTHVTPSLVKWLSVHL